MDVLEQRFYSRHQFIRLAGIAGASLLVAGCSRDDSPSGDAPVSDADVREYDASYQAFDHARSSGEIRESGVLRVGVCSDARPYSYLDDTGNYAGFEVALVKKLLWDVADTVQFVGTDPADVVPYLASNKVDAVICGEALPTDDVWQAFPFFAPKQAIVTKAGTEFASIDELGDNVVCVCKGTFAERFIKEQTSTADVRVYETHTATFQALLSGTASAMCIDQVLARSWTHHNPGHVVALDDLGDPCPSGILVAAQNEDLLMFMNHESFVLVNDGYVRGMYDKHIVPQLFGADYLQALLPIEQDI